MSQTLDKKIKWQVRQRMRQWDRDYLRTVNKKEIEQDLPGMGNSYYYRQKASQSSFKKKMAWQGHSFTITRTSIMDDCFFYQ